MANEDAGFSESEEGAATDVVETKPDVAKAVEAATTTTEPTVEDVPAAPAPAAKPPKPPKKDKASAPIPEKAARALMDGAFDEKPVVPSRGYRVVREGYVVRHGFPAFVPVGSEIRPGTHDVADFLAAHDAGRITLAPLEE